jgi:hypothetical protein
MVVQPWGMSSMSDRLVVPFMLKLDAPLEGPDELSQLRAVPLASLQRLRVGSGSYVAHDLARSGAFAWARSNRSYPAICPLTKSARLDSLVVDRDG